MLPEGINKEETIEYVTASLSGSIMDKADQIDFEPAFAEFGRKAFTPLISNSPMLAMLFNEDTLNLVCSRLADGAHVYINEHGEDALKEFVSSYIREQADRPLGEMISGRVDKELLKSAVSHTMKKIFSRYGEDILEQIDIKGIIIQRIEAMDTDELEELALSVMKTELQAVINLGALIGAIIGILNIFL